MIVSNHHDMAFHLQDGLSLNEMFDAIRMYLNDKKGVLNFDGTTYQYVPNDAIDNVAILENIKNILHADTSLDTTTPYNPAGDATALGIQRWARALFAIAIKSIMPRTMLFFLEVTDRGFTDVNLPLTASAHRVVPPCFYTDYDKLFQPAMQGIFAPSFVSLKSEQRVHQVSSIPLISIQSATDGEGEPEFDVTFHPSHLVGVHTKDSKCEMMIFTSVSNAILFRRKMVFRFAFWCEEKYYIVF